MLSKTINSLRSWPPARIFFSKERSAWALFAVLWVLMGLYLSLFVARDWIPHDEGVLAQQAVRWLDGELPHRDYHETYSGGLTVMNGLAFRFLGVNSLSLRYMLFAASLAGMVLVFFILKKAVASWVAALLAWLVLVWSFPNYFAGLPSWYVVLFWLLGVAFVGIHARRWLDGPSPYGPGEWGLLVAAGASVGLAVTMKISGLFLLPAIVLHLCHLAMTGPKDQGRRGSGLGVLLVVTAIGCHGAGVFFLLRSRPTIDVLLNLILPNMALSAYLAALLLKGHVPSREAARLLIARCSALILGVGCVLFPAVFFYGRRGALGELIEGVFVRPAVRIQHAVHPFSVHPAQELLGLLFAGLIALAALRPKATTDKPLAWALAVLFTGLLVLSDSVPVYKAVFYSFRLAPPFLAVLVIFFLWNGGKLLPREQSVPLFLGVAAMALCSLIQFPFAHGVYFCYITPFVWILLTQVARWRLGSWPRTLAVCAGFYFLFAVFTMNTASIDLLGRAPGDSTPRTNLDLERSSLFVRPGSKRIYQPLIQTIASLTKGGEAIFAGPDCPEIYFLAGRRNPTKILYEVFEDQESLEGQVLSAIEKNRCRVVVLNTRPEFSRPYSSTFVKALSTHFQASRQFGPFVLFVREPLPAIPGKGHGSL